MQPIRTLLRTLNQQLIKLLIRIIRIIQQDHRIPHRLFDPKHPDIRRTPRQMITRWAPSYPLIHPRY